ncbi:MAG: D-alanine--D-alanine ligase family protein [Bacilli bacterium]
MKIKVGVIFGGNSVEHEVSIITAVQAMEYIDRNKYDVVPIYIDKNRNWYTGDSLFKMETYKNLDEVKHVATSICLTKNDDEFVLMRTNGLFKKIVNTIDVAFPIVHGKGVEDGSLAGYLDSLGIPYVGCDVLAASLGQDKVVQKQVLQSEGIPVVNYVWFYENEFFENKKEILSSIKKLGYPVIVKPARLGSSIGITYVADENDIEEAIEEAISYDEKIVVEETVKNLMEVDCAVVGNHEHMETSLIGEMITDNNILTFEDKYLAEGGKKGSSKKVSGESNTGFKIPAKLDKKIENDIYDLSKKAFRALNLKGVTRFDFLVDKKEKKVYVNEPNTIPGCLAFFFFTPKGKKYGMLLDELIAITIKDYKNNMKKISSFDSNVLSTYSGSKGAKGKMSL